VSIIAIKLIDHYSRSWLQSMLIVMSDLCH